MISCRDPLSVLEFQFVINYGAYWSESTCIKNSYIGDINDKGTIHVWARKYKVKFTQIGIQWFDF